MAFLQNILQSLSQPFRSAADITTMAAGLGLQKLGFKEAGAKVGTVLDKTPIGLSQQEQRNIYTGSGLNLFKPAAGVAAYAIPGAGAGGSVAKAAALGAGAGALGGFGASEQGEELKNILMGAGLGGLIGGGTQAIGNAIPKVNLKSSLQKSLVDDDAMRAHLKSTAKMTDEGIDYVMKDPFRKASTEVEMIGRNADKFGDAGFLRLGELEKKLNAVKPGYGTGQTRLAKTMNYPEGYTPAVQTPKAGSTIGKQIEMEGAGLWQPGVSKQQNLKEVVKFEKALSMAGKKPGLTPTQNLNRATEAIEQLGGDKASILSQLDNAGVSTDVTSLRGNIDQALNKGIETKVGTLSGTAKKSYDNIIQELASLPDNPTISQLDEVATKLQTAAFKSDASAKAVSGQVYRKAASVLRDYANGLDNTGQLSSINEAMSTLLEKTTSRKSPLIASAKASSKTLGSGIGVLQGVDTGISVQPLARSAKSLVGRGIQGISNIPQSISSGISRLTQSPTAQAIGREALRVAPAVAGNLTGYGTPQAQTEIEQIISDLQRPVETGLPVQQQAPQPPMSFMQAYQMAHQLAPNASESEALSLAKMIMEDANTRAEAQGGLPVGKTESGRKFQFARDSAMQALATLDEVGNTGMGRNFQGIGNKFYELTGQANPETLYAQQLEATRSILFNALGGTSLTPVEKKQYERFLPRVTDSREIAKQKLNQLIPLINSLVGGDGGMQDLATILGQY